MYRTHNHDVRFKLKAGFVSLIRTRYLYFFMLHDTYKLSLAST